MGNFDVIENEIILKSFGRNKFCFYFRIRPSIRTAFMIICSIGIEMTDGILIVCFSLFRPNKLILYSRTYAPSIDRENDVCV